MRLIRREDVQWQDLPKVESPSFARAWAETYVALDGQDLSWTQGLTDVVWDDLAHSHHTWNSTARDRLLDRVENAEVLLVHGFGSEPVMPIVRRVEDESGDKWKVEASLSLQAQFNVTRMLEHAYETRGMWAPIIERKQPVIKPEASREEKPDELTVSNPRWEHINQQRGQDTPDATINGDSVKLMVDVSGASDGTRVTLKIFDTSISPPSRIGVARGHVEGGIGTGEWKVKLPRGGAKLEFDGEVRRVTSERAKIPTLRVFKFST